MTSAAYPEESGGARALTALTHALPWVLAVGLATRLASWFGFLTWLDLAVALVLLACIVATLLHQRSTNLCQRCMAEVPADAPVRAQRRKKLLWFTHAATSGVGLGVLVVLFVVVPLVGIVLGNPLIGKVARIPQDVALFAAIYTTWLHHRLRPWCPYFRDWDDDGDPEPSPGPSEFGTRSGR